MGDNEIVERVAAGLRAVSLDPDALLLVDGFGDWQWDSPVICGVPVLHVAGISAHCWGCLAGECPFIPAWYYENDSAVSDVAQFSRAYVEWQKGGS